MEKLFLYLTDLSGNVTYAIILGILIACGLGFPLPEDIPLIAAGYLIWDGTLDWATSLFVTLFGVLAGDSILFFFGHQLGHKILQKERMQAFFKPDKINRTRAYFRKYGDKIIFFARFVAGFRAVAFFMAGAMKMEFRRFILLDGLAAIVSVPVWITIGYGLGHYLGDEITLILKKVRHLKTGFTLIVFSIVFIVALKSYIRYRQTRVSLQKKKG